MGIRKFPILARTLAATGAVLLLASCGKPDAVEGEMVSRVVSPDGVAVGLVTLLEGPATVPDSYRVYIQDRGPDKGISEVLRMDHGDAPKVTWVSNALRIEVPCGQIYRFTNFTTLGAAAEFRYIPVILDNNGLCKRRT